MKTKNLFILIVLFGAIVFSSCSKKEGCTDPSSINYDPNAEKDNGTCLYKVPTTPVATSGSLTFTFAHHFAGTTVTSADFNLFNYVNANDDTLSISKLRYLISDIRLYKSNGDSIMINGYQLVDLSDNTTLTYSPSTAVNIPFDNYTGISFIFGFDSTDNVSSAYPDLNSANWNWPDNMGGGYHYMQMEGYYKEQGNDSSYTYHMGIANKMMMSVFEQNYFKADLGAITITNNATIQIKMDISEWYKNPGTWDLNQYHTSLMGNYNAQILMNTIGKDVFSLGMVVQ